MSIDKGKRYERRIAKILSEWSDIELVRTPDGAPEDLYADIWPKHTTEHFPLAVECKHVEGWSFDQIIQGTGQFYDWLKQAEGQATNASIELGRVYEAVLIFTKNRTPDFLCVDFYRLKDCTSHNSLYEFDQLMMTVNDAGDRFAIVALDDFVECVKYRDALNALTTVYWLADAL